MGVRLFKTLKNTFLQNFGCFYTGNILSSQIILRKVFFEFFVVSVNKFLGVQLFIC